MFFWHEPLPHQQKWQEEFSDEKIRKNLGGNIVPIGKNLAGTSNPIGTGTGIRRNWVKKVPLGIHNQVALTNAFLWQHVRGRVTNITLFMID